MLLLFLGLWTEVPTLKDKQENFTRETGIKTPTITPHTHTIQPNFNTKSLLFQHTLSLTTAAEEKCLQLQYHGQCMEKLIES